MPDPHKPKKRSRRKINVDLDSAPAEARGMTSLNRLYNSVRDEFLDLTRTYPDIPSRVLKNFIEIADFMLKNTTGVGSNIRLADCVKAQITREDIRHYYKLVLILLAYHALCLLPGEAQWIWDAVAAMCGDPELCAAFADELKHCQDHQTGEFSPVRAGRKLWERSALCLHIQNAAENATGRIYYQTAPGQDLLYVMENTPLKKKSKEK